METKNKNIILWKRLAQIAGAFTFVISMLLIVNYAQYKRIDPVETELINTLIERLNENLDDSRLREEIRTLDLLVRKAYFTNQWQVRTGGYLLLISIAVLVIAMQMIKSYSGKEIIITDKKDYSFIEQKNARKWISIAGVVIVCTALIFAFLTHNELSKSFTNASLPDSIDIVSVENDITDDELITDKPKKVATKTQPQNKLEKPTVVTKQMKVAPEQTEKKTTKKSETVTGKKPISTPKEKLNEYPSDNEIISNHPSFRGPYGNGISYHKNMPIVWDGTSGENILWKISIPLHGYNSPVVWDNNIFLTGASSTKREVYCIDRNTGKFLWTADIKNIPGSPAKSPKVTDDTGQAAPTVTTDGKRVYAIFANGDIVSLDMDGTQVWARNLGATGNHYGHASSPMLYQDILIVQYDTRTSPKIMGLSASTGKTIWETLRKVKISWASPVVVNTGNQTEILIAADPIVASYSPLSGEENWQINCIFGEVGPSVAYADGIVYAVNEYANLVAIKIGEKPGILWENNEYLSDVPSPVATKDLLFMATSYGVVICYDAKTGEIYWEHEYDNGFYSSPMLAEGKIYLMDMTGIMHVFKAKKEFVSLGESQIGEKCMTTPAFADGKIYIRGNEHLFCIGK